MTGYITQEGQRQSQQGGIAKGKNYEGVMWNMQEL